MKNKSLHIQSPLLESNALSKLCGLPAYTKMENSQPSGSFKIRGLGNLIVKSVNNGIDHLVTASGGNAGMAVAHAGKLLNVPTTVIIPKTTPNIMVPLLEDERATVIVHGEAWNEANNLALEMGKEESTLYVHPYDDPLIWEGCESLVEEILLQCPKKVSAIVVSVGGGGLLCGVLQGILKMELKIPVICMETEGAHCFSLALKAGKPVYLREITSIAKTLGASIVTSRVFDLLPQVELISEVIPDSLALKACVQFADDNRVLVEPSCGATLAAGYSGLIESLVKEGKINKEGAVVFVVCGGNAASLQLLKEWKDMVDVE